MARMLIGDKDEAFKQFSIYLASNPQVLESLDKDDNWEFRELRSDPRFIALLKAHR